MKMSLLLDRAAKRLPVLDVLGDNGFARFQGIHYT
jgi:hypothetical protein